MIFKGSFEDFLYVAIGLVWVAYSIYRGKQKQKDAQKPEGEKSKRKSAIEELLGNFLDIKEDDVVYQDEEVENTTEEIVFDEDKNVEINVADTPSEVFSYTDVDKEGNFLEEKAVYTSETKKYDRLFIKKDTKPVTKRKKPRFNVKKAIIYSEILRRPSY